MIHTSHDAIILTLVPTKYFQADLTRRKQMLQNNENAAKIFYRYSGDGAPRSYACLYAGGGEFGQDLFCSPEELWLYSDTNGAILTTVTHTEAP